MFEALDLQDALQTKYTGGTVLHMFVGEKKPYMVGYVNQFDAIYWYKLFGVKNHPFHYLPIDFASIMFSAGINPEENFALAKQLEIDPAKYRHHNALDDARMLRETYLKFFKIET